MKVIERQARMWNLKKSMPSSLWAPPLLLDWRTPSMFRCPGLCLAVWGKSLPTRCYFLIGQRKTRGTHLPRKPSDHRAPLSSNAHFWDRLMFKSAQHWAMNWRKRSEHLVKHNFTLDGCIVYYILSESWYITDITYTTFVFVSVLLELVESRV